MNPKLTKNLLIVCGVVSALSLLGFILMLAVHIPSFGMWFYYWQYEVNDTYRMVGMDSRDLHEVTRHMIDYLIGRADYLQIDTVVWGEVRPFFSDLEIRHMVDVRNLSLVSIWLRNVFAVIFTISFVPFISFVVKEKNTKRRVKRKKAARRYLFTAWQNVASGIFAAVAVLAFIISIDWMSAWVVFHHIFFNNDYWILNPQLDLLINVTTASFFMNISIVIGGIFAAGLLIMLIVSRIMTKRTTLFSFICLGLVVISGFGILQSLSIFDVLAVLRIIGIVLLCIIGFILIIFALAFFGNLRYDIKVCKENLNAPWLYKAKISFLCFVLRAYVDEKLKPIVRVFGIKINVDKHIGKLPFGNEGLGVRNEELKDVQEAYEKQELPKPPKRKGRFKRQIDKLKEYWELVKEIDDEVGVKTIFVQAIIALKRIMKRIMPKKFKARGIIGLEEPDQTGIALAFVSGVSAFGLDINFEGNFEEKALTLDLHAKGRFNAAGIIFPILRFVLKPEIRRLRKLLKSKNKNTKSVKRGDVANGNRI